MSGQPAPENEGEWQPATSKPGEVFTYEGQIKSVGAFARGMTKHDARLRPYRRSMWRIGLAIVAVGVLAVVLIAVLASVL